MASPKFAWGIDIGNRALKAVKLVRDGDRLRVDDLDVIDHEQILSSAGDNKESLIETALANFVQRHPVKGGVVSIGVSGQSSFARFIKLPPVEPKKIPEIVRFEAIQQIPFPLDEVEWSYYLFEQPDSPEVEVGIFAMRKELVNYHIKHFAGIGMNVQTVQMNPLAVYNALYHDDKLKDGTTMIVDMGAEHTDLIIAEGEGVWLRSIPVGGNNFTEALAKQFKVPFAKAEEYKRTAATSKYARQIFGAMRPVFADLVAEIQRSIGFYASVHRDSRIGKIIALGGTFRLPTLQKYLQQNLQLKVEPLDGLAAGAPADGRLAATLNDNLISIVGAYGLAVQAMGGAKINSSLLPEAIRKAKIWKAKTKWFAAAAALMLVGTAGAYASWYNLDNQNAQNEKLRTDADAVLSKAKKLDEQWSSIERSGSVDRQRISNLDTLPKYRDVWPGLLADIAERVPQVIFTSKADLLAKKPKRGDRGMVTLEHVLSRYSPDLGEVVERDPKDNNPNLTQRRFLLPDDAFGSMAQPRPGGFGGGGNFGQGLRPSFAERPAAPRFTEAGPAGGGVANKPPTPEKHGFLVTIHCTSPSAAHATFVQDGFLRSLMLLDEEKQAAENKPYYVARAMIRSAGAVLDNPDKKNRYETWKGMVAAAAAQGSAPGGGGVGFPAERPSFAPSRGEGGGFRPLGGAAPYRPVAPSPLPGGGPVKPEDLKKENPLIDPITEEDASGDWEYTLLLAVALDPQPAPKGPVPTTPGTRPPGPSASPAGALPSLSPSRGGR